MIIDRTTDTFFIAVCMISTHSFLAAGVQQENGEYAMLLDVGKAVPRSERHYGILQSLWLMMTGQLPSDISNDQKLVLGSKASFERKVNYMAYAINYQQYLDLLAALKQLNPGIIAYVPTSETDEIITLDMQHLDDYFCDNVTSTPALERVESHQDNISLTNNCRSAALDLASLSLREHIKDSISLPTCPLIKFPCTNVIKSSRFVEPLFIMPPPPTAYHTDVFTLAVITPIYRRMEKILRLHNTSADTREKFDAVKDLYLQLVKTERQPSLKDLLASINSWAEANKEVVDHHRGVHFFWQRTSTRKLVRTLTADAPRLARGIHK